MKNNKLFLIISREFLIRVRKKSFIIMTILTPILFAALIILPSLIMTLSSGKTGQQILVVDHSGLCEPFFNDTEEFIYTFDQQADVAGIKKSFPDNLYALVEISEPDSSLNVAVSALSSKQLNLDAKSEIERNVKNALEKHKLERYNIENLEQIIKEINTKVSVKTFTVTESGDEKVAMVEIYMGIAYIASFMIYMFIFMFGSMVMRGVIEEKTTRIVEVIVSSVRPFQLMLGKILGVGSVAMLQFLIWILLTVAITAGVQSIIGFDKIAGTTPEIANVAGAQGTELAGVVNAAQTDSGVAGEIFSALSSVPVTGIVVSFILYFLLGYLLYAAMFAAVGSAVDNEADTQQLIFPVTLPLILGLFIMIHTFQHPDSALSFWGSMIPFTSPMVMMARVPFGVPFWELALSVGLLAVTFLFMTYVSAKIYRVGILMYGKKPNFKDLYKWLKY
ncbi:MAG: ABC transporter permease [Rikenellaceae bacterium]|nr:ABC transporter permease [Rikenellaceae bacterium]